MTASILIVDDEPDLLDSLCLTLTSAGYHVLTAASGVAALTILHSKAVNLILADIAMPELNGYQLLEKVRQNPAWLTIPFVFLTARKMDSDIRYGKSLGVDDYLTKPVHSADLLAVIEGKLRRQQQLAQVSPAPPLSDNDEVLNLGGLRVDSGQHRVWVNDREVYLSAREFALLEYLARQRGKVVSVEELVQATHHLKTDHADAGSLVRSLVHAVRRKTDNCVENVRGVGYRIAPPAAPELPDS
jgi:DNA-binding response OmpR family regulator